MELVKNDTVLFLGDSITDCDRDRQTWRIDLDPKIQIVRHLAAAFHCQLLPLDGLFAEAAVASSPQALTGDDGVHPTPAGHALIADQLMARLAFSSEG
ncbi:hypothetical protein PMV44_10085 [Enterococcus casseliflavus]|uniref:hypothetical protein n=1 Tax=Enterococcus casseliflavus TaxID=37734 RepID=UPI00232D8BC5|nr:hypothetical protein [Enterococcus casseliflavus]MDB1692183.1 hypothetical protein [Enterococcus casseliflavus]